MPKPTVTIWSDYVCPWCYLGLAELETLRKDFDFEADWRPFMLRPDAPEEGWPLPDRVKAFIKDGNNPLAVRAKGLGIVINHREHVPNSRRAHECTEYARAKGKLEAFHHHVLERYWSHSDDIHDWAVLKKVATEVGLDADELQKEVDAGQWRAAMEAGVAGGAELGINSVPTFIVGNKFMIQGAQEARVFRQAFERLQLPDPAPGD